MFCLKTDIFEVFTKASYRVNLEQNHPLNKANDPVANSLISWTSRFNKAVLSPLPSLLPTVDPRVFERHFIRPRGWYSEKLYCLWQRWGGPGSRNIRLVRPVVENEQALFVKLGASRFDNTKRTRNCSPPSHRNGEFVLSE